MITIYKMTPYKGEQQINEPLFFQEKRTAEEIFKILNKTIFKGRGVTIMIEEVMCPNHDEALKAFSKQIQQLS
jgi:hypothetical protein